MINGINRQWSTARPVESLILSIPYRIECFLKAQRSNLRRHFERSVRSKGWKLRAFETVEFLSSLSHLRHRFWSIRCFDSSESWTMLNARRFWRRTLGDFDVERSEIYGIAHLQRAHIFGMLSKKKTNIHILNRIISFKIETFLFFLKSHPCFKGAKEKYRGVFEIQKSGDKTSSGKIFLSL